MKIMIVRTFLWVDGNLPGDFFMLDTSDSGLIRWSMLMSYGGHTRDDF